jgi:hypothetical protein
MDYPYDNFAQDQLFVDSAVDNAYNFEMNRLMETKISAATALEKLKNEEVAKPEAKESVKESFSNMFNGPHQYLYIIILFLLALVISQNVSHQSDMRELYKAILHMHATPSKSL